MHGGHFLNEDPYIILICSYITIDTSKTQILNFSIEKLQLRISYVSLTKVLFNFAVVTIFVF